MRSSFIDSQRGNWSVAAAQREKTKWEACKCKQERLTKISIHNEVKKEVTTIVI